MPRIRYQVAMSLDGYIAGPKGEFDWIVADPDIDFGALFAQFDTFLMGRETFSLTASGGGPLSDSSKTFVFSRTMRPEDNPTVTIVPEVSEKTVAPIRAQAKKDIWLFGGGSLFRSFLDAGLVDTIEVAVIPVLLGGGIPLLQPGTRKAPLRLTGHRVYKSGIVSLEYAIDKGAPRDRPRKPQSRRSTRRK